MTDSAVSLADEQAEAIWERGRLARPGSNAGTGETPALPGQQWADRVNKTAAMPDTGGLTRPWPELLPRVSVVIPVLNEERYIEDCLRTVLAQDYPRDLLEVIVVDGPSTDRTAEIVRSLAAQDGRVRLLSSPTGRIPCSLNIGLTAVTGTVVVRVDGHSAIAPGHVRRLVTHLGRSGADHVGGVMRATGRTYVARAIALAMSSPFGVGTARFRYTNRAGAIDTVPFGAYRLETLRRLGGFDEGLPIGEDAELDYRITLSGGRVWITPEIETEYYCRDSFRRLARQYIRYGRAKAAILHKHGALPSPRALAPAIFVLGLGLLGGTAPLSLLARRALAIVLSVYALGTAAATVYVAARRGWRHAPLLPVAFATLHLSHGLGFLSALPLFLRPRPAERLRGSLGQPGVHNPAATLATDVTWQTTDSDVSRVDELVSSQRDSGQRVLSLSPERARSGEVAPVERAWSGEVAPVERAAS